MPGDQRCVSNPIIASRRVIVHILIFQMTLMTRREEEVVHLVADGLKNREIAQQLKVKEHSIRNYIYRIFEKLGVSSRVELILYVFSHRENGS
jgi:DNA-binding NarL/FixJ family response regulator